MQQVELFSQPNHQNSTINSKDNRPPNISVSKVFSPNNRWKECKVIGKNISIRSYSAGCVFQNRFYLYGGYQILAGSLHDFYSISLDQSEHTFNWDEIPLKGKHPGSRSKHALLASKSKIYLIGGLMFNNDASNEMFEFDPISSQWSILQPSGDKFPPLQSFGAILISSNGEEKIIIVCGFNQTISAPTNTIYEYNITKNKLSILFQGTNEQNPVGLPLPRVGCAVATDSQNIYIFGGKNEATRFNDIWSFSLTNFKYSPLKNDGEVPFIRNGHTMNFYNGKLYVFGGIHDITWELDDLHIYDIQNSKWTTLEQESPRKLERKQVNYNQGENKDQSIQKNSSKKRGWYETASAGLNKLQSPNSSNNKNFTLTAYQENPNRGQSPGKMLDEQRKKVFYNKKAEMLKNFQISKEQKSKLIVLETSSQAMKNSLDVIGNPDPKMRQPEDKLTDFGKESISKFLQPLHNNSNIVLGKKPCARDGHVSVIMNDQLIIFGGDRHQMSFNDIYKMNLKLATID